MYAQESLPSAPGWSDVQQILATTETDKPADIRNRAILMLLSIYGMRRGEVVALRLDQVDWAGRTLHVFRLKRRQPQVYPLLRSEEHTSELQSLMRSSYAVFCLQKKNKTRPLN